MQEILQNAERIAASESSVLIIGEHGTGKEWIARAMHKLSVRSNGPFWPFDCAAIASDAIEEELFGRESLTFNGVNIKRGAIEEAEGGILLLNEIDVLPVSSQMKIARTLEYHNFHRISGEQLQNVNVRIIATSSQPVENLSRDNSLLKGTFYRISPLILELPPLRERREDIPLLIDKFLSELAVRQGATRFRISEEAVALCVGYDWPGNILNLKNAMEYASVMCAHQYIEPTDLPVYIQSKFQEKGYDHDVRHKERS